MSQDSNPSNPTTKHQKKFFKDLLFQFFEEQKIRNPSCLILPRLECSRMTLLTSEEKELLTRAASLMEELLETLEVMQDRKLVRDLKASLREVEEGKTVSLNELLRDLDLEAEVHS